MTPASSQTGSSAFMSKALAIFNPLAGRGRAYKQAQQVRQALAAVDLPHEIVVTETRGHAIELARRAVLAGRELIVAVGGDGTLNEVVNGLMQAADGADQIPCTVGVLPVGSGNDFAGSLGIPSELREAAERLRTGQVRRVDIGRVNDRYFDNNVGLGFEAMIDIEAQKLTWLRGFPGYLLGVFRAMARFPFPRVRVQIDGQPWREGETLMISVGNNRRIGGGFLITPKAVSDDGLLDMCYVDAIPRREILRLLPKAIKGNHEGEPAVHTLRFRHAVVESDTPLPVHADGEVLWHDAQRLEITVYPGRLPVIV